MSNETLFENSSSSTKSMNNTTLPDGLAQIEFWITLVLFIGVASGFIGTIGNSAIAVGVIRSKKLRTRFFIIICYLAVNRAITGVQALINLVYRTLRTLDYVRGNMTRMACYFVHFQHYYNFTLEMLLLLALVIDRTLAVAAYKYYRRLTFQQANKACALVTTATALVKLIPSLLGVNIREVVPCINSNSPTASAYNMFSQHVDVGLAVLILVVYIYLIFHVRFRFMSIVKKGGGQEGERAGVANTFNQHRKLMPVLTRLVWLHIGLTLTSKIFRSSQYLFPPKVAIRISVYMGVFVAIDTVANIAVLLTGNDDLKEASIPCYKKPTPSVVGPSSSNNQKKVVSGVNVTMVRSIRK